MASYHDNIVARDLVSIFQPLIEAGSHFISADDGKIHKTEEYKDNPATPPTIPWMFVSNPRGLHCDWWRTIVDMFNFIPSGCRCCWKVVVRPRTLAELMQLWEMQKAMVKEDPTCFCKCGIEKRSYVFGNYGGYFYNRSKEEGLKRKKMVREWVDKWISPDVSVTLKRGCTEIEMKFGPSDGEAYEESEESKWWEAQIKEGCKMVPWKYKQPPAMQYKVIREWIKYAWSIGDPTVFSFTEGKPLVPPAITYDDDGNPELPKEVEVGTQNDTNPETGDADSPDQPITK